MEHSEDFLFTKMYSHHEEFNSIKSNMKSMKYNLL